MGFDRIVQDMAAIMLASLRLAPVLAFAPPFTLVKVPGIVRVTTVMALAAALSGSGAEHRLATSGAGGLAVGALGELGIGLAMALSLQLAFAAIGMAGRALDIQAGFGLAFLVDPTTKAQMPLIGAAFTYAAAAMFFATSAPQDLVAVLAASFDRVPLGGATGPKAIGPLLGFLGSVSVLAVGLVGLGVLVLFLVDLVIALLSRTLPQMNMLVLGFQVKSIVALAVLPATLGLAGAGIVRIIRLSLDAMLALV